MTQWWRHVWRDEGEFYTGIDFTSVCYAQWYKSAPFHCAGPLTRTNKNLELLDFGEGGIEDWSTRRKTLRSRRKPGTNSNTPMYDTRQGSISGHIGERQALSPLQHPCYCCTTIWNTSTSALTFNMLYERGIASWLAPSSSSPVSPM